MAGEVRRDGVHRDETKALSGLILGMIGLLFSSLLSLMVPGLVLLAIPCIAIGLPLSLVAFNQVRKCTTASSEIPLAGMAINILAIAFIIVWIVLIVRETVSTLPR